MLETDEITYLKGVGPKRAVLLNKLGIENVGDMMRYYPRAYTDYCSPVPISELVPDDTSVFRGIVTSKRRAVIRKNMTIFKIFVTDGTDDLLITLFNNKFAFDRLKEENEYIFYGKIKGTAFAKECNSPLFIEETDDNKLVPKYSLTEGISSNIVSRCVKSALENCRAKDALPLYIRDGYSLIEYNEALRKIHFPRDYDELDEARRRLAFEELLSLQLGLRMMKSKGRKSTDVVMENTDISDFLEKLSFTPTGAQLRAIEECIKDMKSGFPMSRLLQGDVGSGKTLVAAALCCIASKNGYQSAFMAPTEILAKQHYDTVSALLEPLGISVVLLTGSSKKKSAIYGKLTSKEVMVAVGTHAIVQDAVKFSDLGLVITDEQHRFGVEQRTKLTNKGVSPHTLVMSATPIPRTLAFTIYGELEVSVLDEMPKGRIPIRTYGVDSGYRERIYNFIIKYINNGFQAYIVCPKIEENEDEESDKNAVVEYYNKLKKGMFRDIPVGLLHGRMKASEKDAVMTGFKSGEIKLLVSTTVIEVGVDVPNAVIMVIENAEQFGLSQLHQLRGRVGRGSEQSHCILITDNKSAYTKQRIDTMVRTSDGFEIAEEDLKLRGPGNFFGSEQHGLPELRVANFSTDIEIINEVNRLSESILSKDKTLSLPENEGLRRLVKNLFRKNESYGVN